MTTTPATSSNTATPPAAPQTKDQAFTEPVPLTRPPLLLGITLAVILLTVGVYAVATAKVTTQIEATGVMLSGGFTTPVVATQAGQVTALNVKAGDQLTAGQEVAQLFVGSAVVPVVTPLAGEVLQTEARVGEVVDVGEPLFLLVDPAQPLVVSAPVPADDALQLRSGQQVRVLAADASTNDPAFVLGQVAGVQALPSGAARDTRQNASGQGDSTAPTQPTREVTVTFANNPTSADQLQWEGTAPNPSPFGEGAIVRLEVITGEQSVLSVLNRGRS